MALCIVEWCKNMKNYIAFGSTLARKNPAFYERFNGVSHCRTHIDVRTFNSPKGCSPNKRVLGGG